MYEVINYIETDYTKEELKNKFIKEFISVRKENNLTQNLFGLYSGVPREKIARIEGKMHSPSIDSLIDILAPIGYTIKIVKIDKKRF